MASYKIHLLDRVGDSKVPYCNEYKVNGYKVAICGYQRKYTTTELNEVTCKICLREHLKNKVNS